MADVQNKTLERVSWWLRNDMRLKEITDAAPGPSGLPAGRCDLHAVGHAKGAFVARFMGMLLTVAALFAVMIGARPAEASAGGEGKPGAPLATTVAASLGALGLGSFVAGGVIERRTRYHVWLQCETRAITRADVGALLAGVEATRGRVDATWQPDQLWLVGSEAGPEALRLARAEGVRCFALRGSKVFECGDD